MTEYVEVQTQSGDAVPFEVEEFDGPIPAGRRWDATVERASQTLDVGVEHIKEIARTVAVKIADMSTPPDKVTVELGIKVSAGAGVVVAKSTAEAHIKVSLEWGQSTLSSSRADSDDSNAATGDATP